MSTYAAKDSNAQDEPRVLGSKLLRRRTDGLLLASRNSAETKELRHETMCSRGHRPALGLFRGIWLRNIGSRLAGNGGDTEEPGGP